ASSPDPDTDRVLPDLDVDANELALVYRARGLEPAEAERYAQQALSSIRTRGVQGFSQRSGDDQEALGTGLVAALSSFCFFASGAAVPVVPLLFGMGAVASMVWAIGLVGLVLLMTGAIVGLLTGGRPGL